MKQVAAAYSRTAAAWDAGPGRIYDRLAATLVDQSPVPMAGRRALDVGAGTGAVSRAVAARGGRAVAVDAARAMVAAGPRPGVVADALGLPFDAARFDAAIAGFCLNHVASPAAALREMARVTTPGGVLLASSYAADDGHPVKAAVDRALYEAGWELPEWCDAARSGPVVALSTAEGFAAAADDAGLREAHASHHEVAFDDLGTDALLRWRLGMAQSAAFFGSLDAAGQAEVTRRARELLGEPVLPLVRSVVALVARPDRALSASRRQPWGLACRQYWCERS